MSSFFGVLKGDQGPFQQFSRSFINLKPASNEWEWEWERAREWEWEWNGNGNGGGNGNGSGNADGNESGGS